MPENSIFVESEILALGSGGDGVAQFEGQSVFVPRALPGEFWRLKVTRRNRRGFVIEPIERLFQVDEQTPICKHFGRCGGCKLQHLPPQIYRRFKALRLRRALDQHQLFSVELPEVEIAPLRSRRRIRMAYTKIDGSAQLGFRAANSRDIVAVEACPIAVSEIDALIQPLRRLLARLECVGKPVELMLTQGNPGIELVLLDCTKPSIADIEELAVFAQEENLARISWRPIGERDALTILERYPMAVTVEGTLVAIAPTSFLQATRWCEEKLRSFVARSTHERGPILDLFSGFGALSLGLAMNRRKVMALDVDQSAIATLRAVASRALGARMDAQVRDLYKNPLQIAELERFSTVILDPPRAGAPQQIETLVRAAITRIIYVSCHPGSFARDAKRLIDGGFVLRELSVLDQFLYSVEIEIAALFERA